MVYSNNIFKFATPSTICLFASTIHPQCRNALRRLHIQWSICETRYRDADHDCLYTFHPGSWQRVCDTIAADMLGLEELYIELNREGVFLATDSDILDPMRVV